MLRETRFTGKSRVLVKFGSYKSHLPKPNPNTFALHVLGIAEVNKI
jgi:hypothetical protein